MTTIIKQKTWCDCLIAAYAMWLDKTYLEIEQEALDLGVFPKDRGMYGAEEFKLAESFGVCPVFMPYRAGLRGILTLPSLNIYKGAHAVFVDHYRIYDPSTAKSYAEKEKYFPSSMHVTIDLNEAYSKEVFSDYIEELSYKLKSHIES